jgi:hypothetical protein
VPRDVKIFQRLPEKLFALTLRIVVRRIKEVDAAVDRRLDQFVGPALANGADALEDPSAVPESRRSTRCPFGIIRLASTAASIKLY